MSRFIDIHSHKSDCLTNVWQLRNLFPEQEATSTPFSIGIHPWYIAESWQEQMNLVAAKVCIPNCMAIGECGFDKNVSSPLELQQEVFAAHVELANQLQKPLIIHCVRAYDELLNGLKDAAVPVILHDFGKSAKLAQQLQQKKIFLSIGKAAFRPAFGSTLSQLDREFLFLETDDTEYTIDEIYRQVAQLLDCELVSLQQQIQQNFNKVFR